MSAPEYAALRALAGPGPYERRDPLRPSGPTQSLAELRGRRAEVLAIVERFGIGELMVFGSVARGTEGPESAISS